MRNKFNKFIFSSFSLFLTLAAVVLSFLGKDIYAQEKYRDPFTGQFPQKPAEIQKEEVVKQPESVSLPQLTISGILWGRAGGRVIINGKIYKPGDTIEESGVKIHKIEKNNIFVLYKEGLFEVSIIKKDFRKTEAK